MAFGTPWRIARTSKASGDVGSDFWCEDCFCVGIYVMNCTFDIVVIVLVASVFMFGCTVRITSGLYG